MILTLLDITMRVQELNPSRLNVTSAVLRKIDCLQRNYWLFFVELTDGYQIFFN